MSNVSFLNSQIEQYQKMWILANQRGDQQAMAQAHQQAEALRQQGGTIRADQDTPATLALKQAVQTTGVHVTIQNYSVQQLNRGIVQAKQDYLYAQARGDHAAMQAASTRANNYRALGGTITANTSLVDAIKQVSAIKNGQVNGTSNVAHISAQIKTMSATDAMQKLSNATAVTGNYLQFLSDNGNPTLFAARMYTGGGSTTTNQDAINENHHGYFSTDGTQEAQPNSDGSITMQNGDVVVPPTDPDVVAQNTAVGVAKLDYLKAQILGDQAGMAQAVQEGEQARQRGATIGADQDTAVTSAVKGYLQNGGIVSEALQSYNTSDLNKAIVQVKNDYLYAQQTNDSAGMAAASFMGNVLRDLGGTIGSDVSLNDAKAIAYGTKSIQGQSNSGSNTGNTATTSSNANLPNRATMTAAMIQYLKATTVPNWYPDDYKQKAAEQDFKIKFGNLSDAELAAKIKDIVNNEKQSQHFQQEIQSGIDQNVLLHENGYTQYAVNQAYQQDPLGGIQGILQGFGIGAAFGVGSGGDGIDQSGNVDENGDNSQTQEATGTEGVNASNDTGNKLDWDSVVSKKGESRLDHVSKHGEDDMTRETHGVFNSDPKTTVDEAWSKKGDFEPIDDGMGGEVYNIPMKDAGYLGGKNGSGEQLNYVTIVVLKGSNKLVTAFPSDGNFRVGS